MQITTTDTGSAIASAAVISYVIGLMKNSNWKIFAWISAETPNVNRAIAFLLSGAAAIGIHATFAGGTLIVTGLTATVILSGLYHWGVQFCYTHGWFKATSQSGEMLEMVKTLTTQMLPLLQKAQAAEAPATKG